MRRNDVVRCIQNNSICAYLSLLEIKGVSTFNKLNNFKQTGALSKTLIANEKQTFAFNAFFVLYDISANDSFLIC